MPSSRITDAPPRPRGAAVALALVCAAAGGRDARAVTHDRHPNAGAQSARSVLEPGIQVASGPEARLQPDVTWSQAPARAERAWKTFVAGTGKQWTPLWDADTGVPLRIFGAGVHVPGSVASAATAETAARQFLTEHIGLLAPGSRPDDFVVVGNHLGDGIRTVGMHQHHRGMRVITGQLSFRFKNDRLFVIASEALPDVDAPLLPFSISTLAVAGAATDWVRADVGDARPTDVDGPFVLPIVSHRSVSYHTVMRATVDAQKPDARFHVYVDAESGVPVAREQILRYADGTVLYNVPERHPGAERADLPASHADIVSGSLAMSTDAAGALSWDGDAPLEITAKVTGELVNVLNQLTPELETSASFVLAPGGTVVWDERGDEEVDAQISAFVHAHVVKAHVRRFAPKLEFLDEQLQTRVNINSTCNAFSDGTTINFFRASADCENTARLADVVYHEFGHALHWQSIIPGVGAFDGAFSEGLSDYLAATITGDPAMGVGFFKEDEPLRHIDPPDYEHRWPRDVEEIHYTGLIFAGAMWDLRKELVTLYGEEQGAAVADRLFYAAVQRASSIPATYVELLAADDDDGNLENGTPHECLINAAFGALHGLRNVDTVHEPLGAQTPAREDYRIATQVTGTSARCDGDRVASVIVQWERRGTETGGEITATPEDGAPGLYAATIPQQPDGSTVRYRVVVTLADGGVWEFPDNQAVSHYEFYVGEMLELYCTDFESDPFAEGWSHGLEGGFSNNGADDWQWGTPTGSAGDPDEAFSGTHVLGNDLGAAGYDGKYQGAKINYVESPLIDVGDYSDVHVQYRRWLGAEDSRWDYASIYANGHVAWRNLGTSEGNRHHIDSEWMFHDVPVSQIVMGGSLQVRFAIDSDSSFELGGWTIDDFCVVARPDAICGNGTIDGVEQCDQGAANDDTLADACRSSCRRSFCGDGVRDSYEECDDGNDNPYDGCTLTCYVPTADSGCNSAPGAPAPAGALGLAILVLLGLSMRRRRGWPTPRRRVF
jgi:MYXO-CTERM domain-containing protein